MWQQREKGGKSIKSKEKNASVSFFFLFTIPVCLFVSFFFSSVTGEKKGEGLSVTSYKKE